MTRRAKILWLFVGALFVVGLVFLARSYVQICELSKDTPQGQCASLRFALVAFWHVLNFLDDHNGVMTAIATGVVAWFTFSLRQSTDKLWDAGNQQRLSAEKIAAAQSADMQASVKAANDSAKAAIASNQIAVDNAAHSVFERFFAEVNQQSELLASDAQVRQHLLFVDRSKLLNGFKFDKDQVVDD